MIGVSSSGRSFKALGRYLVVGRGRDDEGRVAWRTGRNLPTDDPELAAKIMRATASQNVRTGQPVYHLALSFDPDDAVDRATMERVADRLIAELRLQEHQVLIVAHADRKHQHMHILVNRVHPETGRVWDRWQDYALVQRVLRDEERVLGLRAVEASLGSRQQTLDRDRDADAGDESRQAPSSKARSLRFGQAEHVSAIRADFDAHERTSALSRQRFDAEMEIAALQARATQFQSLIRRTERADASFTQALAILYRDPEAAKSAFFAAVNVDGPSDVVRRMRDAPEQFGGVHFNRPADVLARATQVAARAAELLSARQELVRFLEAELGTPAAKKSVDGMQLDAVVAVGEERLRNAREHLRSLQKISQGSEPLKEIEFRLSRGLERLSPPEFTRLCMSLSGNQLSLACKLRHVARDVVLGREESH